MLHVLVSLFLKNETFLSHSCLVFGAFEIKRIGSGGMAHILDLRISAVETTKYEPSLSILSWLGIAGCSSFGILGMLFYALTSHTGTTCSFMALPCSCSFVLFLDLGRNQLSKLCW
jgi:hypothetical protein